MTVTLLEDQVFGLLQLDADKFEGTDPVSGPLGLFYSAMRTHGWRLQGIIEEGESIEKSWVFPRDGFNDVITPIRSLDKVGFDVRSQRW